MSRYRCFASRAEPVATSCDEAYRRATHRIYARDHRRKRHIPTSYDANPSEHGDDGAGCGQVRLPLYAIDEMAIKVVEVVSEGEWKQLDG
jgi:hypothetical protein